MTPHPARWLAAAVFGLSATAAPAQYFVPTYVAPTQPGISNYYAPTQPGIASYRAPTQPGIENYYAPVSPSVAKWVGPTKTPQEYYWHKPSADAAWTTVHSSSLSQSQLESAHVSSSPSALLGNLFGPDTNAPVRSANDIHVVLPNPDAKVMLNGAELNGTGRSRHLALNGVSRGAKNEYTITATWTEDGKPVTKTQKVHLDGTGHALADFR
jgi:uncharacterized protein (TIGR03000 family)